ncbi:hypothetical protein KKF82_05380 [Patescibacteria group bacterium]|nr:hypothetical protein [Patescibacteria group bacterium]
MTPEQKELYEKLKKFIRQPYNYIMMRENRYDNISIGEKVDFYDAPMGMLNSLSVLIT